MSMYKVFILQDGQNDCSRKACPSLSCRYQVQDKNSCCARCALNKAEVNFEDYLLIMKIGMI